MKSLFSYLLFGIMSFVYAGQAPVLAQDFKVKDISTAVKIFSHPDLGNQLVIISDKGLVVFNSFWSDNTAHRFKKQITETLGRDDFAYVINTDDRLDMMGGNGAYPNAMVVSHENILSKYSDSNRVAQEISDLVDMWREKEGYSKSRLEKLDPASDDAEKEENWMKKCRTMADELENSFNLVLPGVIYRDRITLDLGNLTLQLNWFGKAGNYNGLTMALIRDEDLAIISKSIVYPEAHLASYPFPYYGELDVSRWIKQFENILEGSHPVDRIVMCDSDEVYSREQMVPHLKYIRTLWDRVNELKKEGKRLEEIQNALSLDGAFDFVKEMHAYKANGDRWIRPQHDMHTRLFYFQGETMASEIIRAGGPGSLEGSLKQLEELGDDVCIDETSLDYLSMTWMERGYVDPAIEVLKFRAQKFPQSVQAYASLGEAFLRIGDQDSALQQFKKALELDPQNGFVQFRIKGIEEGK